MARKTKAEQLAEQQALRHREEEQARQEYLPRMMQSLEEAQNYGYVVLIKEGKLNLRQEFSQGFVTPEFAFSLAWTWNSQYQLEELEDKLAKFKREREEELARIAAKEAALNKLTAEERKLLGL